MGQSYPQNWYVFATPFEIFSSTWVSFSEFWSSCACISNICDNLKINKSC